MPLHAFANLMEAMLQLRVPFPKCVTLTKFPFTATWGARGKYGIQENLSQKEKPKHKTSGQGQMGDGEGQEHASPLPSLCYMA